MPYSSVENYKATSPWNKFKEVLALTDTGVGISKTFDYNSTNQVLYNIKGQIINNLQKGLNIIRMDNGKTKKVVVK